MWEENLLRLTSGERVQCDQSAFLEGLEAGLQVARDIADWLDGQDKSMALKQIERDRVRLRGNE